MPDLLAPAVDPTTAGPADVYVSAGLATVGPPTTPPGPGDPDAEYAPVSTTSVIEVEIRQAITHAPIGFLRSAVVADWVQGDVELLAGTAATVTASPWDPLWLSMGVQRLGSDGLAKASWDPKGYEAILYRDGKAEAPYIFMQPVDVGGGVVALPLVGPQEQINHRFLGRPQQVDLLDDRGSFETDWYSSIADMEADGWYFPPGVTASIVSDGVRGSKALRLTGGGPNPEDGWVRSKRITVTGAAGYSRVVDGQVFGKWSDTIPEGAVVARAATTGTYGFGDPVYDVLYAAENSAVRPNQDPGWTTDPVPFAARLAPTATAQRAYLELKSFEVGVAVYDLAQLRLSVQTGFPPGSERDLSEYVVRIHRDSTTEDLGGHPDGMTTSIESFTGRETSQRWSHASRLPLRDVYAMVLEADEGPECWVTTGWVLTITDRLGSDRPDLVLSPLDVVNPSYTTDPAGQFDDYIVDTGRGTGVSWLAAVVEQDRVANRRRVQTIVQGPTERTLNEIEAWAAAHGRAAARLAVTATASVRWELADQIVTGDVLRYVPHDGNLGESQMMRVLRKHYFVKPRLCELSLGLADA